MWIDYLVWILPVLMVSSMIISKAVFFKSGGWKICLSCMWTLFHACSVTLAFVPQPRVLGLFDLNPLTPFTAYGWIAVVAGSSVIAWSIYRLSGALRQIRFATSGMQVPHFLVTDGCYRKVRHPFYAYLLIFYAGYYCVFNSPVGLLLCLLFGISSYHDAIKEEEKQLIPLFGERYLGYSSRVRSRFFDKTNFVALAVPCTWLLVGAALFGVVVPWSPEGMLKIIFSMLLT